MDQHVTFGSFRFEPGTARLWENGAEVKLTRKAAMVLGALLERPGAPVSKQELFANVWRGTVVSDDALVTCIQELRKALGDDSKQPLYIETRHRLGYRFAAPVAPGMAQRDSAANTTAIAVLPFTDMSEKRDQDYLCEGLAEELIDALTHVEGLRVEMGRCRCRQQIGRASFPASAADQAPPGGGQQGGPCIRCYRRKAGSHPRLPC
jgi:DNA-binding winged helix-turn-helix (wHTH) protein